ncbi:alpha-glucosidase, partial [Tremellales sp. Uapishka_1]
MVAKQVVTHSPGYTLSDLKTGENGIQANLSLSGAPTNIYGKDIKDLILEVEYQSSDRIHVHIYDASKQQYQIPQAIFPRPPTDPSAKPSLEFHQQPSPFAFWITRSTGEIIFDTRPTGIPTYDAPLTLNKKEIRDTTLHSYPLVFQDQYLQLATSLPKDANIYGLGEVVSSSGLRRDNEGTVQTYWNRDAGDPSDENLYGTHAFYMETRWNKTTSSSASHGVFLLNSHGMDVVLRPGVLEYRALGGTLDFYFVAGTSPKEVIKQYSEVVGRPTKLPYWAFGFHLLRWGWKDIEATKEVVEKMEKAKIPLETIWNDLDYMFKYRNFTLNDVYPYVIPPSALHCLHFERLSRKEKFKEFTNWLHARNQHYIPIVDAAIALTAKEDKYDTYDRGHKLGVFVKDEDGDEFVGKVWPGSTVFPDWTAEHTYQWWKDNFDHFKSLVDYDGIWLDMNEPASFDSGTADAEVQGSASHVAEDDGKSKVPQPKQDSEQERSLLDDPPYAIHNHFKTLRTNTMAPKARNADGSRHYNTHNIYGHEENLMTSKVLLEQNPDKRPFILSRSTFAGSGTVVAHWLGDNRSTWQSMRESIQGVLQFQMFQIPMVGPDTGGFVGDSTEELCNRWMQLSSFYPFFRNHNVIETPSQEPYVWKSVTEASIKSINIRYQLLPLWETLFAQASKDGTPPLRPLFHEFDDPSLFDVDAQFLVGSSLLITPVLHEGKTSVEGVFPSTNGTKWVDWFTHKVIEVDTNDKATLETPLGHINIHTRSGSVLLIYNEPKYTLEETRKGSYGLVITLDDKGTAQGEVILDDGISVNSKERVTQFSVSDNKLSITSNGKFEVHNLIENITILGLSENAGDAKLKNVDAEYVYDATIAKLEISKLALRVDSETSVEW